MATTTRESCWCSQAQTTLLKSSHCKGFSALVRISALQVKQSDKAKFGGAPKTLLPSLEKGKSRYVTTEQYCNLFTKAACGYYRRALKEE
eukprot:6461378-Amphidinium_carterae.2